MSKTISEEQRKKISESMKGGRLIWDIRQYITE